MAFDLTRYYSGVRLEKRRVTGVAIVRTDDSRGGISIIGGRTRGAVTLVLVALLFTGALLSLAGCGGSGPSPSGGSLQGKVVSGPLPERIDRLAFKLMNQVTAEDSGKNVFLSPASLEMALAMTMNGAAGGTLEAMSAALELQGLSSDQVNLSNKTMADWLAAIDPKVTLSIANSLWARRDVSFSPTFLADNKKYYDANVKSLDFSSDSAAATINGWVSDKTNGKIKEMIKPPIDAQTILILLNAIYFKGQWTEKFDKSKTQPREFTTGGGATKSVPMMTQSGKFKYLENDAFQAIFLPYGSGKTGMYVFLPKTPSGSTGQAGLQTFINGLTPAAWVGWMTQFKETEGDISIPRFTLEYEKTLNDTLAALGMGVAFTDQADFSRMLAPGSTDKPFIQKVKQKTFADVNEEGTEAAAATSVEVGVTALPPDNNRFNMVVDHPFFFAITDEAGKVIIFEGAVLNP